MQWRERLTGQDKEQKADEETISHIQYPTGQASKTQFGHPIQQGVPEHVHRARPSRAKCPPLPVVILTAEKEVDQENGDGCASDDHDAIAEEKEAEHVVDFAKPHVVHDEVEFDKDGAEGEDADEKHGRDRAEVCC